MTTGAREISPVTEVPRLSPGAAARIAGLALLAMAVAAPFAELFVYPKLVVAGDPALTVRNIAGHPQLFVAGILGYLITYACDVVAAWALWVFFRRTHPELAILTASFRIVYAAIAMVALLHLVTVFQLLTTPVYAQVFGADGLTAQVRLALGAFRNGFGVGLVFFGIHLVLLGVLAIRSRYVPGVMGILLLLAGLGYLVTSLGPLLLPGVNLHVARYTFYGELVFMQWLLFAGSRLRSPTAPVRVPS